MGETEYRGGDGPLAVSLCTDPHAGHKAFLAAVAQQQYKVDARYDFNVPTPVNVAGYYQKNILDGKRHSVADAFLTPALSQAEPRSAVAMPGHEDRVRGKEGRRHRIPPRRQARDRARVTPDRPRRRRDRYAEAADAVGHRAGGSLEVARHPGHRRRAGCREELPGSPEAVDPLERQDGTAGLDGHRRHVRAIESRATTATRPTCSSMSAAGSRRPIDSSPSRCRWCFRSRAAKSLLRSADPLAAPIIRANYLQEQADVDALVRGVKLARWFGEADAYADLKGEELLPGPAMKSDAELAAFARRDSDTIYHGAGTCKMGPAHRSGGSGRSVAARPWCRRACASRTDRSCRRSSTPPPTPPA